MIDANAIFQEIEEEKEEREVIEVPTGVVTVDFYQPRQVIIERPIKGKAVEFTHQTVYLADQIWLDFNDTLNPRQEYDGKKMTTKSDDEEAIRTTYKALVKEIPSGYQQFFRQELTVENFSDLIPIEDQEDVINKVFAVSAEEAPKGDFYFDGSDDIELNVDVPINGDVYQGKIFLAKKTQKHKDLYGNATKPETLEIKKFKSAVFSTKANFTKLQELLTSLTKGVGVFADNKIPVWCQVEILNYYFTSYGQGSVK